jgi:hypothetical protein
MALRPFDGCSAVAVSYWRAMTSSALLIDPVVPMPIMPSARPRAEVDAFIISLSRV